MAHSHADGGAQAHSHRRGTRFEWVLFFALVSTIPAFYLHLAASTPTWWWAGSGFYLLAAAGVAIALKRHDATLASHRQLHRLDWRLSPRVSKLLDRVILIGALASLVGNASPWHSIEWVLRLALVAVVAARLAWCLLPLVQRREAGFVFLLGIITLLLSGAGFYWLEPTVRSYADGLWLAFESGATVGYGDIVPTTPGARVFAVFMVLIGYALLSLATASIAALLIGRDEERLRHELHHDMKALHAEVLRLREELRRVTDNAESPTNTRGEPHRH